MPLTLQAKLQSKVENEGPTYALSFIVSAEGGGTPFNLNLTVSSDQFAQVTIGKSYTVTLTENQ